jgi:hypothetical protein
MVGFAPASPTLHLLHLLTTAVTVSLIQGLLSSVSYGDLVGYPIPVPALETLTQNLLNPH